MGVSKIRGTLFGGPYNKDPTIYIGYYIRVPYFRKLLDTEKGPSADSRMQKCGAYLEYGGLNSLKRVWEVCCSTSLFKYADQDSYYY